MVSLSLPALPWLSTSTPALMVEYGQRSSTAPCGGERRRRRRRCSGNTLRAGGHGLTSGPVSTSLDRTSSGSSSRQYRSCSDNDRSLDVRIGGVTASRGHARKFITLSVHLICLQHVRRDAVVPRFWRGSWVLGPHLTQCRLGQGLSPNQEAS